MVRLTGTAAFLFLHLAGGAIATAAPPVCDESDSDTFREVQGLCELELRVRCASPFVDDCPGQVEQPLRELSSHPAAVRYAGERTVFKDYDTGHPITKMTHHAEDDEISYFDIPAYTNDGRYLAFERDKTPGPAVDRDMWIVQANGYQIGPLTVDDPPITDRNPITLSMSKLTPNIVYYRGGTNDSSICSLDIEDPHTTESCFFDVDEDPLPHQLSFSDLLFNPPHRDTDNLLFRTENQSPNAYFAVYDMATGMLEEVPNTEIWDLPPPLPGQTPKTVHRIRFNQTQLMELIISQDGRPLGPAEDDLPGLFLWHPDGFELEDLTFPSEVPTERRPGHGHPGPDGSYYVGNTLTGNGRDMWRVEMGTGAPPQDLYSLLFDYAEDNGGYNSVAEDGSGVYRDVPDMGALSLYRGRDINESFVHVTPDGRGVEVLGYHFGKDGNVFTNVSPDGTKIVYVSDMLLNGEPLPGDPDQYYKGDRDVYVLTVRPPNPPRNITATCGACTQVSLSWDAPLHDTFKDEGAGVWWNSDNLAREIDRYNVYRRDGLAPGVWEQVDDGLVTGTSFIDDITGVTSEYLYYSVQAVEHSGLISVMGPEVAVHNSNGSQSGLVYRRFGEAETATFTGTMVRQSDWDGASGGWYVGSFEQDPEGTPGEAVDGPWTVSIGDLFDTQNKIDVWVRLANFDSVDADIEYGWESPAGAVCVQTNPVTVPADSDWQWYFLGHMTRWVAGDEDCHFFGNNFTNVRLYSSQGAERVGIDMIGADNHYGTFAPASNFRGNLDLQAPAPPTSFHVSIQAPPVDRSKELCWDAPSDPDLSHFNVYAGPNPGFQIGQKFLLYSPIATEIIDWAIPTAGTPSYKITAVDHWGNESVPVSPTPGLCP